MKIFKSKSVLIVVFLVIGNLCFAQVSVGNNGSFSNKWFEGKLILKNRDTLVGVVKFESGTKDMFGMKGIGGNRKVFFKENRDDKKKIKYKRDKVESFVVTNNSGELVKFTYVKTSKNGALLVQVLTEGKVSLYLKKTLDQTMYDAHQTNMVFYNEKNLYYVKKQNEDYVSNEFFDNAFKSFSKTASNYFSDCESLVQKIDDKVYRSDDLFEIIQVYNACH